MKDCYKYSLKKKYPQCFQYILKNLRNRRSPRPKKNALNDSKAKSKRHLYNFIS